MIVLPRVRTASPALRHARAAAAAATARSFSSPSVARHARWPSGCLARGGEGRSKPSCRSGSPSGRRRFSGSKPKRSNRRVRRMASVTSTRAREDLDDVSCIRSIQAMEGIVRPGSGNTGRHATRARSRAALASHHRSLVWTRPPGGGICPPQFAHDRFPTRRVMAGPTEAQRSSWYRAASRQCFSASGLWGT